MVNYSIAFQAKTKIFESLGLVGFCMFFTQC